MYFLLIYNNSAFIDYAYTKICKFIDTYAFFSFTRKHKDLMDVNIITYSFVYLHLLLV